jgi:cytidylate kinase
MESLEAAMMDNFQGIVIFGPNGSSKTTLGLELARILGFKHMDIEDYCFVESEIPYTQMRSHEEYIGLMLNDIRKYRNFVVTSVAGEFGKIIPTYYRLGVRLNAPLDLRLERVKRRAFELHGKRVLKGGDMYEQERRFLEYVASRTTERDDRLEKHLCAPLSKRMVPQTGALTRKR